MIAHLLRLVWARKRSNALLILEIFAAFLVVFAVVVMALSSLERLRSPLGFSWDSVWVLSAGYADHDREQRATDRPERTGEMLRELAAMPEVEAAAAGFITPYEQAVATTVVESDGRSIEAAMAELSDDADRVLGLRVVAGRWFEAADDGFDWTPVVINRLLADELFPGGDPVGQALGDDDRLRVVGVVEDFRWGGELAAVRPAMVQRVSAVKDNEERPSSFLVRTAGAVGTDFEERAQRIARTVAPDWTISVKPMEDARRLSLRMAVAPLAVTAVVAGSLMLMVMFGMVGVFWQAVTVRHHEIGLRRALGATQAGISRQFLAEVLLVTAIGVALAMLVIVQLPLLGLLEAVGWGSILVSLAASALLVAGLAVTAGLYPSWVAARVQPVDALRDE